MTTKRVCKDERLSLDIISTLPETILEIILCLLPTKEAARTSILSREWRYKWNKIPKLEFEYVRRVPCRTTSKGCRHFSDVHQVLLLRQGPLHELTIHICPDCDSFEFDQILLHLANNHTLKKLTLDGLYFDASFNIPISVFSLHHLTHLDLSSVNLEHQPIFNGFASLRSLDLFDVDISTKTLLHLLSNCPSLESFSVIACNAHINGICCTVIDLFKCLPVIEHLTTCYDAFEWLVLVSVPKELPTLLFQLRYFYFESMCFTDGYGLAFLLILIKCSPNLQKLKLEIVWDHECDGEFPVEWEEYSNVWLEHLNELEIKEFGNSKPEMDFVKFILARSPKLKKVSIHIHRMVGRDDESEMLKVLLETPRASPPVIITVR